MDEAVYFHSIPYVLTSLCIKGCPITSYMPICRATFNI